MSGVVKVFPLSSLSLARKSTRKKRAQRSLMTKWDLKLCDCILVGRDWAWAIRQQLAQSVAIRGRVASWSATRLVIARSIDRMLPSDRPHPVRSDEETVMRLEIPFRHQPASCSVSSWSIFSLTKEN